MTRSPRRAERPAVVVVKGAADAAVWLAAHLMSERAYVRLSPAKGGVAVELRAKSGGGAGLAAEFKRALASQRHRWALAQASLPERAAVLSRALELSKRLDAARRQDARPLEPERARELARLAAAPVEDPLGIRAPWDQRSGT